MKRSILAVLFLAVMCFGAQKIVLDQSITITWSPGHYDTVWVDGVKAAVWIPAKLDTTIPVMEARKTYKVTDTIQNGTPEIVDSTDNFFSVCYRKHGARVVPLDTVKVMRMQPGSSILNKVVVLP